MTPSARKRSRSKHSPNVEAFLNLGDNIRLDLRFYRINPCIKVLLQTRSTVGGVATVIAFAMRFLIAWWLGGLTQPPLSD
jgi:hypothetical protein